MVGAAIRRRWRALLLGAGIGLAICALIEPALLTTRRVPVATQAWPQGRAPLTIAFLTDIHAGSNFVDEEALRRLVTRTNALKPDLVLLGGDYVSRARLAQTIAPEIIAAHLKGLSAPLGVVAVLGNHDWWYDGARVWRALAGAGIAVLENDAVRLDARDGPVWVAGLADASTRMPSVAAAFARIPAGEPVIVISHDPVTFPSVPPSVAVTLAGHTHGGQIALPSGEALVTPGHAPRAHAYGLVREGGRLMYVSSGIGTSILPLRLFRPPEIALISVTSR